MLNYRQFASFVGFRVFLATRRSPGKPEFLWTAPAPKVASSNSISLNEKFFSSRGSLNKWIHARSCYVYYVDQVVRATLSKM